MNLTSLKRRVQNKVGLAAAAAGDEKTLVEEWADEAALKFLQKTKAVKKTAVINLTANEGDYTINATVLSFEDTYIEPADGSQDMMLVPVDSYDIRRMRQAQAQVAAPPYYYAYEAGVFMIYPSPASSSDKLHIVFVQKPSATFVGGAGTESWADATRGAIPTQYHDVLEAYVAWRAAEYSNDSASRNGESYRGQWEQGVIETKVTEARRAGVRTAYATVGRRHRSAAPPGVDTGN